MTRVKNIGRDERGAAVIEMALALPILLVSHDRAEVARLAEHVVELRG